MSEALDPAQSVNWQARGHMPDEAVAARPGEAGRTHERADPALTEQALLREGAADGDGNCVQWQAVRMATRMGLSWGQ